MKDEKVKEDYDFWQTIGPISTNFRLQESKTKTPIVAYIFWHFYIELNDQQGK